MTFPLPYPYVPGDAPPDSLEDRVQQNFDKVALALDGVPQAFGVLQLAAIGTKRRVSFGISTIAWAASALGSVTVTHGLGTTPAVVVACPVIENTFGTGFFCQTATYGGSTFALQGEFKDGVARTGNGDAAWVAIG